MQSILVSYASKHGSTQEIAETIATTFRKHQFEVDLLPANAVESLDKYQAVIFGSAVYAGAWTDEAMAFLKRFDVALEMRPVFFFSSGPTGKGEASAILQGWKYPEAIQAYLARIKPEEIVLFHGKLELETLPLVQRWLIKAMKAPLGDFRQWAEIQAWAENIVQQLSHQVEHL
jgi:menaquinone-dependent protoporphyrinogen oxidase